MEIGKLKFAAWQELRASVNKDPWGLPYMLVLKKLKPASLGLTELLEPEVLTELLKTLFLKNDSPNPIEDWSEFAWSNEWAISLSETIRAIRKVAASWTKAPGPDGFRMVIWMQSTKEIQQWIRHLYNLCLIRGEFPLSWKSANLVLIPKENKSSPSEGLPKVRPICLLNEIGKTFERVIAERISL